MSVRQVVISDLHLGARDSLLTHVDNCGSITEGPSLVLEAFANSLRETLNGGDLADGKPRPNTMRQLEQGNVP